MADSIFTPQMQQQISQLLQQQTDRSARTTPIHQAAMAMASRMAPGYAQGAMTAPRDAPPLPGGLPSVSSGGGPGVGGTVAVTALAALLKTNSPLALALKKLLAASGVGGAGDPTFGGLIAGNKPFAGGTGFPDVPVGGAPSSSGGMSGIPGYFQNPDGSMVGIGGDAANGGGYGGGVFPSNSNSPALANGGGDFGPFKE